MIDSKTIAVTGASGQVGSAVLNQDSAVQSLSSRFDDDMDAVLAELHQISPKRLINAAAYTQVDRAEAEHQTAFQINGDALLALSNWCGANNSELIHFSTDYVFNGQAKTAYLEHDAPDPINVYGRSKLAGEQAIGQHHCRGLIIRTSWVLGSRGRNFVTTILRAGLNRSRLQVVDDQWGRPTSAELLALVARTVDIPTEQTAQLMHLSDAGEPTTWFEIARYALSRARDYGYTGIGASCVDPIKSSGYPTAARRPLNSLLDCSQFDRSVGLIRRPWQETVDRVVEQDVNNW